MTNSDFKSMCLLFYDIMFQKWSIFNRPFYFGLLLLVTLADVCKDKRKKQMLKLAVRSHVKEELEGKIIARNNG